MEEKTGCINKTNLLFIPLKVLKNGFMTIMFKFCTGQPKVHTSILWKIFGLCLRTREAITNCKELQEFLDVYGVFFSKKTFKNFMI